MKISMRLYHFRRLYHYLKNIPEEYICIYMYVKDPRSVTSTERKTSRPSNPDYKREKTLKYASEQDSEDEDDSLLDEETWTASSEPPPPMNPALQRLVDSEVVGAQGSGRLKKPVTPPKAAPWGYCCARPGGLQECEFGGFPWYLVGALTTLIVDRSPSPAALVVCGSGMQSFAGGLLLD